MWSEDFITHSFQQMDQNGDGRLDARETAEGLERASDDIRQVVLMAQPDKNGCVTAD